MNGKLQEKVNEILRAATLWAHEHGAGPWEGAEARAVAVMRSSPDLLAALQLIARSNRFKYGTSAEELQRIARAVLEKARLT